MWKWCLLILLVVMGLGVGTSKVSAACPCQYGCATDRQLTVYDYCYNDGFSCVKHNVDAPALSRTVPCNTDTGMTTYLYFNSSSSCNASCYIINPSQSSCCNNSAGEPPGADGTSSPCSIYGMYYICNGAGCTTGNPLDMLTWRDTSTLPAEGYSDYHYAFWSLEGDSSHTISPDSSRMAGYSAAYGLCPAGSDCPSPTRINGNSVAVTCPANSFVKINWYFTPTSLPTPPPSSPPPSALAWWQAKDADIIANGSIRSYVPPGLKFILDGLGTFPGVAIFGKTKTLTFGSGTLSSKNWKAQTDTNLSSYIYASFKSKIPTTVNPCNGNLNTIISGSPVLDKGYAWFTCSGTDLNLTGPANIGDKKIVIMVEGGNVNIKTKINLTKGMGFFGVFTTGDINISKDVGGSATYDLEGIYFADGNVNTAYDNSDPTTSSLKFRGSVVGMGGVSLQRDLGADNATNPAEFFEYAPDQLFLLPSAFSTKKTQWQEVAP